MKSRMDLSDFLQFLSVDTLIACWQDVIDTDEPDGTPDALKDMSEHASAYLDDSEFQKFTSYTSAHKTKGQ